MLCVFEAKEPARPLLEACVLGAQVEVLPCLLQEPDQLHICIESRPTA
jgi:hypothetical protein